MKMVYNNCFFKFCIQTSLTIPNRDPFTWYAVRVVAVGEGDLLGLVTADSILVNRTNADGKRHMLDIHADCPEKPQNLMVHNNSVPKSIE